MGIMAKVVQKHKVHREDPFVPKGTCRETQHTNRTHWINLFPKSLIACIDHTKEVV
jgi:hypothetical protein